MSKCLDDELYDIYIEDGKQIIESLREIYEKGRADAINELADVVCCSSAFTNMQKDAIRDYAEQLKEKNK